MLCIYLLLNVFVYCVFSDCVTILECVSSILFLFADHIMENNSRFIRRAGYAACSRDVNAYSILYG
jgi:hypothetical protein